MNLYLIRHGESEQTSENKPHEERALTEEGITILRNSSLIWQNFVDSFDIILTSPLRRAKQTAEIIKEAFGVNTEVIVELSLLNGGQIDDLLNLATALDFENIAMVGHQPDIGIHIASMIGSSDTNFKIPPASIAKIHFKGNPVIGKGILEFLLPPINKKG